MKLEDPIAAYNAENNIEATLIQHLLASQGVPAHVTEDVSMVGHWMFGNLPEIYKPQVWISRVDSERAAKLLHEYEQQKRNRNASREAHEGDEDEVEILIECEECGESTSFDMSLYGTVQDCSHCGAYVDVGEVDWPDTDFGEAD